MSDPIQTTYYRTDSGIHRVRILSDDDASSPRENDNPTVMQTWEHNYTSPDGKAVDIGIPGEFVRDVHNSWHSHGIDLRRVRRWVNLFGKQHGILAVAGLRREDRDGSLALDDYSDDVVDGVIAVTVDSWKLCMGDSPVEGGPWLLDAKGNPDPDNLAGLRTPSVTDALRQDVDQYNHWAHGGYVGYVVEERHLWTDESGATMHTWEHVDSCWGIDDTDYAQSEALSCMTNPVEIDRDEIEEN